MEEWKIKGKPALVILRMQERVGGSLINEDRERDFRESDYLPHQQALLNTFRLKNLPVIFVNLNIPNDSSLFPAYGVLGQRASTELVLGDQQLLEVIPELSPQPGEPVIYNWFFDILEITLTSIGTKEELALPVTSASHSLVREKLFKFHCQISEPEATSFNV